MTSPNDPKVTAVHALPVITAFPAMKFDELVCVLMLADTVVRTESTTLVMFAFVDRVFIYSIYSFVCCYTVVEIVSYIPQNFFDASVCFRMMYCLILSVSIRTAAIAPSSIISFTFGL